MADEKIQVHISSRAELGGFTAAGNACKGFAKANKDAIVSVQTMVSDLSAKFSNDLTVSVGKAFGIIGEIGKAGLWGGIAKIASMAIDKISERMNAAKERAKELASVMRAEVLVGFSAVDLEVKKLSSSMQKATEDMSKLVKAQKEEIDAQSRWDAARLRVDTLKNVGGMTSEDDRAAAKEESDLAAIKIRGEAEVRKANVEYEAWFKRSASTGVEVEKAEDVLSDASRKLSEYRDQNSVVISKHNELVERANESIESLTESIHDENTARRVHAGWVKALSDFEKDNKEVLDGEKKANETLKLATEGLAKARENAASVEYELKRAGEREVLARKTLEADLLEKEATNKAAKRARESAREDESGRNLLLQEEEFAAELRKEDEERRHKAQQTVTDRLKKNASELDKLIEAAKDSAKEWEKSAEKMRGKTFKDWMAEESNGRKSADAADIWLAKALRWADGDAATFMLMRTFSMWCKPDDLPDPDDADRITAVVNKFAREVVGEFTMRELDAAVRYAEDGCCHLDAEACPSEGDDRGDEMPRSACCSHAVGLLNQGVFLKVGSVSDMSSMTVSQLEALVAMALRADSKSERSRRLGEYFAVLEEIKGTASKPSEADAENEDADHGQVENHADPPAEAGELDARSGI